jgi:hypothetical protein
MVAEFCRRRRRRCSTAGGGASVFVEADVPEGGGAALGRGGLQGLRLGVEERNAQGQVWAHGM